MFTIVDHVNYRAITYDRIDRRFDIEDNVSSMYFYALACLGERVGSSKRSIITDQMLAERYSKGEEEVKS